MVTSINFNDLFYLSYFMLPLIDCTQLTSHLPMLMPHLYLQLVLVYCVFFSEGLISKKKKKKNFWKEGKTTHSFFKAAPRNCIIVDSGRLCGPKQCEQHRLVSEHLDPANACMRFKWKKDTVYLFIIATFAFQGACWQGDVCICGYVRLKTGIWGWWGKVNFVFVP